MQGDHLVEKVAAALPDTYPSKPGDTVAVMMVRRVVAAMASTIPGGEAALIALLSGEARLVATDIIDRFPEINPSNWGEDEVIALNNWGIEVVTTPYAAKEGRDG